LLLGCPRHRLYKKTVITSHENRHCAVTTAAFGQGSGPVAVWQNDLALTVNVSLKHRSASHQKNKF
ncbi:hypothetical protein, partial [Enterobacter hormaechei]